MSKNKAAEETDKQTRIAIVSTDKCKPKRCRQECKRSCPVVRMGKLCIEVAPTSKIAVLSEELCIGCGICVKVRALNLLADARLLSLSPLHPRRNARSRLSSSSTCRATWKRKLRTGTPRTPSSCIDCRFHVQVKFWDWWVRTVSASPRPLRSWRAS